MPRSTPASHKPGRVCSDVERLVLHIIGLGGETTETNPQLNAMLTGAPVVSRVTRRFRHARLHMAICPRAGGFVLGYRRPGRARSVLALLDRVSSHTATILPLDQRVVDIHEGIEGQFQSKRTVERNAVNQMKAAADEADTSGLPVKANAIRRAADDLDRYGHVTVGTAKVLAAVGIVL